MSRKLPGKNCPNPVVCVLALHHSRLDCTTIVLLWISFVRVAGCWWLLECKVYNIQPFKCCVRINVYVKSHPILFYPFRHTITVCILFVIAHFWFVCIRRTIAIVQPNKTYKFHTQDKSSFSKVFRMTAVSLWIVSDQCDSFVLKRLYVQVFGILLLRQY